MLAKQSGRGPPVRVANAVVNGAPRWDRTTDFVLTKNAVYQLTYGDGSLTGRTRTTCLALR